jgi:hypothetical protein
VDSYDVKDDVVSQMLGGDSLQEFTGTGAMGTVEVIPMVVNRRKKRFQRRKLAEATSTTKGGSLIPSDAEKVSSTSSTKIEGDEDDEETEASLASNQDLLQPELALVAPDCTPNATKPIDPAKVPAAPAPAASVPPLSTVQGREDPRAASVLGLFTGGSQSQTATSAVESLAPGLVPGVSGEALMRGGMPDPVKPSTAAVKHAMNRFRFA